jgi:hypothetical protein
MEAPTTDAKSNRSTCGEAFDNEATHCSICYEAFADEATHLPRILVCNHSFCSGCLARLARTNDDQKQQQQQQQQQPLCPKCRQATPLESDDKAPSVVDQLPRNFFLLPDSTNQHQHQHQQQNQQNQQQQQQCQGCANGVAVKFCLQCNWHFCSDCNEQVHSPLLFQKHVRIASADAPAPRPTCGSHNGKLLEYWCEQDGAAMCASCMLVGPHAGHKVVALEEAAKRTAQESRRQLALLEQGMQKLEKALADVAATKQAEQQSAAQARAAIAQHFVQVREAVDRQERALVGELAAWEKERGKARKAKQEKLLAEKERLAQVGRHVQEMMGFRSGSDTAQHLVVEMEQRLVAKGSGTVGRLEAAVTEVCSVVSGLELLSVATGAITFKPAAQSSSLGSLTASVKDKLAEARKREQNCKNCRKTFCEAGNQDGACLYHPGLTYSPGRRGFFICERCGGFPFFCQCKCDHCGEPGFSRGCTRGRHSGAA